MLQRTIILAIAFLLLSAAGLKASTLADQWATGELSSVTRFTSVLICSWEILLAYWLLSSVHARASRAAGILTFGAFAIVSVWHLADGRTDCSCFGKYSMPPAVMVCVDATIVLALILWKRCDEGWLFPKHAAALTFLGILSVFTLCGQAHLRRDMEFVGGRPLWRPYSWIGHTIPIASSVDWPSNIESGRLSLLFLRTGCRDCDLVLDRELDELSSDAERRLVVVDLEQKQEIVPDPRLFNSRVEVACTVTAGRPIVVTPVVLKLEDGVVINVKK